MLNLVDYEYYSKIYGGSSIPESSFNKYSLKASSKVNHYTFNRINDSNIDDNIRNATCEIIDLLVSQDQLIAKQSDDTLTKASETVGPHTVSYVNKSNLQAQRILNSNDLEKECYKICYTYLADTGLMYRGVY